MDFDPRDNDDARDDQRWGYERDDRERDLGSVREASGDSRDDSLEHLREEGLIRSLTRSSKPTSAGRAKLQHDAQLFRAYLEIERPLREKGAEISRVVIETDLKREYRQFLQEHNRGRPEHTVITELAEMGVADHVLESISGHLSRRMLEHYSHIRIDHQAPGARCAGQPAAQRRRHKRQ